MKYEIYYKLNGKPMLCHADSVKDIGAVAYRFHKTMQNKSEAKTKSSTNGDGEKWTEITDRHRRDSYKLIAIVNNLMNAWYDDFATMPTPDFKGLDPYDGSFGSAIELDSFPERLAEFE